MSFVKVLSFVCGHPSALCSCLGVGQLDSVEGTDFEYFMEFCVAWAEPSDLLHLQKSSLLVEHILSSEWLILKRKVRYAPCRVYNLVILRYSSLLSFTAAAVCASGMPLDRRLLDLCKDLA